MGGGGGLDTTSAAFSSKEHGGSAVNSRSTTKFIEDSRNDGLKNKCFEHTRK
jgi:hypothetical protein